MKNSLEPIDHTEKIDKKFRYVDRYYQFVRRFDIGIGNECPVASFKEWEQSHWDTNHQTSAPESDPIERKKRLAKS